MRLLGLGSAIPTLLIAVGVPLSIHSCTQSSPTVAKQFERYAKASASHDLRTLKTLTSDDVVWQLGPRRLAGKEAALGPSAYDLGTNNTLIFRDIRVDRNVVECELVERNEIVQAIGMTEVRHYPRFTFESGLVAKKEASGKNPPVEYSMSEFNRRMAPLRNWIRDNHPEAILKLLDSNGAFVFSQANGALMLRLTREWVAVGAPGQLTTQ